MPKINLVKNFLLFTVFCAPLYLVRLNIFLLPTNVFEILAIVSVLFVLAQRKKLFFADLKKLSTIFLLATTLIITGLLLSIFFNKNYLVGLGILKGWFIIPMLFSWSLYQLTDSLDDVQNIFKAFFMSAAAIGLISIFYKFFGYLTYDQRLASFYLSPNYLAMYLAPGVFFGIYFFKNSHSYVQKVFYPFLLAAILAPLYWTYSYGTWLAIIVSLACATFFFSSAKKYVPKALLVLFFSLALLLVSQLGTQKFDSLLHFSSRSSFASRITIWQVSWKLVEENVFLGIGPGNFQAAYLEQQPNFPPYLEWAVPQPHNILLAFWLEAGILGLVGFIILLYFIFSTLRKLSRNKKSAAFTAPLFGYFLYVAAHGLIDTTYWKNDLALLFWICVFLSISIEKFYQNN